MRQTSLRLPDALIDIAPLADALGLQLSDILREPPPCPADTGAAHLMVRIRNSTTIDAARPDATKLLAVLGEQRPKGATFKPSRLKHRV